MRFKNYLLIGLGFLTLGLGAIGLLIPVWPTTPFVLVSVACFSSTPRLRARIMHIRFFREYVESYEQGIGLSKKTVAISFAWLWGMLLLSMLLIGRLWMTLLLLLIGTAVTVHILHIAKARPKTPPISK